LIEDSRRKYKLRSQATSQKKDPFIANKKSDEILLVYPFGEDKNKIEIEAAASNLNELSYKQTPDLQDSNEKPSTENKIRRQHKVTKDHIKLRFELKITKSLRMGSG
jgi:hypothetical protein